MRLGDNRVWPSTNEGFWLDIVGGVVNETVWFSKDTGKIIVTSFNSPALHKLYEVIGWFYIGEL
jgi:hypothetical protein